MRSAWSTSSRGSRPSCGSACCPTGRRCPMTSSHPIRTWCRSGWRPCTGSSAASSMWPSCEFPLDEAGRARFRSRWRELFEGDPSKKSLYRDVSNGVPAAGIEYYLPLFFEAAATLFDYLPQGCSVALHRDVSGAIQDFWREASSRFKLQGGDPNRPLLPPPQLFVPAEEFYLRLRAHPRIDFHGKEEDQDDGLIALPPPSVAVDRRAQDPLAALKRFLDTSSLRVMVAAESPGRRETMASYFAEY